MVLHQADRLRTDPEDRLILDINHVSDRTSGTAAHGRARGPIATMESEETTHKNRAGETPRPSELFKGLFIKQNGASEVPIRRPGGDFRGPLAPGGVFCTYALAPDVRDLLDFCDDIRGPGSPAPGRSRPIARNPRRHDTRTLDPRAGAVHPPGCPEGV